MYVLPVPEFPVARIFKVEINTHILSDMCFEADVTKNPGTNPDVTLEINTHHLIFSQKLMGLFLVYLTRLVSVTVTDKVSRFQSFF